MDLSYLSDYIVLVIVGICLCVGFVIKTSFSQVDNRCIPLIVAILGTLIAIWSNNFDVTPEIILAGMFSGLASTGLHQAFKTIFLPQEIIYYRDIED